MDNHLPPKLRFDGTINWGHVLVALTIVGGIWAASSSMSGEFQAGRAAREKYIPMVEAQDKTNDLQNDRISRMADAIAEMRKATAEVIAELRKTNADMSADNLRRYETLQTSLNNVALAVTDIQARLSMRDKAIDGHRRLAPN